MRPGIGALLLASLCGLGSGCRSDPPRRPNLVLVVVDTLRSDHLGTYGYSRATSPHLDRLAATGTVFENARAPSSWTKPSVASLFTARRPSEHGAVSFSEALAAEIPTLAELLGEAGYRTVGVSANFVHVNPASGLTRGFDAWRGLSVRLDEGQGGAILERSSGERLRAARAPEVNRALAARLAVSSSEPLFLYVHYMEPHAPYAPPENLRRAFARVDGETRASSNYVVDLAAGRLTLGADGQRWLIDLYDAEVAAADRGLGQLVSLLDEKGYWDDTVLIFVSDHGEEFAEHGGWFHGLTLYEESLRVPLVVHDARAPGEGVRRTEPVDLLDVAPTLLALAGVEPARGMRGRPLLGGDPLARRDLVAELHPDPPFEDRARPRLHRRSLLRWPWKAIVDRKGAPTGYRLDQDPGERAPLAPERGPGAQAVGSLLALDAASSLLPPPEAPEFDPETREGLRALGYAQ
ncbi:MAG: sulfatase [Myxococcota bacterium]